MRDRIQAELEILREIYGDVQAGPDGDWVLINGYKLPPGWNKEQIKLLILIPPGYPTTPPDNFYVNNELRLANGSVPGSTTCDKQIQGKPWLQFSYHVESPSWSPHADILKGHNLLTFMRGVEERLCEVN